MADRPAENGIAPLGLLAALFWPITIRLARRGRRDTLRLRRAARLAAAAERRKEQAIRRMLRRETMDYAHIIIQRYAYLGEFHRPKTETDGPKRRARKKKIHKVRFDAIRMEVERIYLRIATTERGLFGFESALPYQVRVVDLISPDTLMELSIACKRQVTVDVSDIRRGCWLIVNRLEGVDGLPKRVDFGEFLKFYPNGSISELPAIIGVGEHRKIHRLNLANYPHMLIGGSSGGGKSNMLNVIIAGLMRFVPVDDVRFILIDFKRLEFSLYEGAPHLLKPIIFETADALAELQALQKELDARTRLMEGVAKDVAAFNEKRPEQRLHRIFCVIDEYAVIRLDTNRKLADQVENILWDIGNRGRALGIHLIICTQRPAREVLSNRIKINMALTIAARTQNNAQSMTIVDDGSAARLPDNPRGRMIYLAGADHGTVQAPYISDQDVTDSIRIARGKQAGVISLDRGLPTINYDGLLTYLKSTRGGILSKRRDELLDLAITPTLFKSFRERLLKENTVVKRGADTFLVLGDQISSAANDQADPVVCVGCGKPGAAICDDCLRGVFPVAPYSLPDSAIGQILVSARPDTVVGHAVMAMDRPGVVEALGVRMAWMISDSRVSADCVLAAPGTVALGERSAALAGLPFGGELRRVLDVIAVGDLDAVRDKRVLVVGATAGDFTDCASALCAAGARSVVGLAVVGDGVPRDVIERARAVLKKGA